MQSPKENICDRCKKCKLKVCICIQCRATMCIDCWTASHNRPELKSHIFLWKHENILDYQYHPYLPISYFSPELYRHQSYSRDPFLQKLYEVAHELLFHQARNGNPMMLLEDLASAISFEMGVPKNHVTGVLEEEDRIPPTIHRTLRSFGDFISLKYYSLCLSNVSVESIIWIMKSIKNDKMQSHESLLFSRFKEYFAIKVSMKDWKRLLETLHKMPEILSRFNKFKEFFEEIEIKEIEEGNYLVQLKNVHWVSEDLLSVQDEDQDYISFKDFIDKFFEEEAVLPSHKESERKKWLSSYKNSKKDIPQSKLEDNYKKIIQNESINKAIPGGKYGCTLLVKNCGTPLLKSLSIGRIYGLIKHALNRQIINHLKTHIVKNDKKTNVLSKFREQQIVELQRNIIELLEEQENKEITLAQLPLLLQKKYHKFFNIQELGFPKLKNFLVTIEDEVALTKSQNNHIKVSLIQKPRKKTERRVASNPEIERDHKRQIERSMMEGSLNINPSKKLSQKNSKYSHLAEHENPYNFGPSFTGEMTATKFCELFEKIKTFVINKITKVPFGVEIDRLEDELNEYLKVPFKAKQFGRKNFKEFLKKEFASELEIEVKKRMRPKMQNTSSSEQFYVYPKVKKPRAEDSDMDRSYGSLNPSTDSRSSQVFGSHAKPIYSWVKDIPIFKNEPAREYTNKVSHPRKGSLQYGVDDADDDQDLFNAFGQTGFPFHSHKSSGIYQIRKEEVDDEEPDDQTAIEQKHFVSQVCDEFEADYPNVRKH